MDNYASFCFVEELPELLADVNALEARLRLAGNGVGADRVIRAYSQLKTDLTAMGAAMAVRATEILRRHEHDSRVRPDTLGGGGPALEDYLVCEPVPTFGGMSWGSIGVANETLLDAEVEWWWTNEEGYTGHVGRVLYGTFEPGGAPPDASEFRQHPLFEPSRGASGVIRNPIPARRFILHALPDIGAEWHTAFDAVKATFSAEIAAAMAPRVRP